MPKKRPKTPIEELGIEPEGATPKKGRVRSIFQPVPFALPIPPAKPIIPKVVRKEGMSDYKLRKLRDLIRLKLARRIEAIRLYEPLPIQTEFHKSQARRRVVRAGNRGGKTLMAAMDLGMAATGQHPYIKFPKSGRAYVVAKDGRAIGETLYPKLFKAGAFKIIRDEATGQWRSYRPWIEADKARESEAKPAPPIIPPRLVASVAWENKKENVPRKVVLTNGWEISFFTSGGKPPQGMDIDLCLAGSSEIYDPVLGDFRRIDKIREPWHVYSENNGKIEIRRAQKPFIKGYGEIVRVDLSNGESLFTTRRHRVLVSNGEWVSVQLAHDDQLPLRGANLARTPSRDDLIPAGSTQAKFRTEPPTARTKTADTDYESHHHSERETGGLTTVAGCDDGCDLHETQTIPGYLDDCSICFRPDGERPRSEESSGPASFPLQGYAAEHIRLSWHDDAQAFLPADSLACLVRDRGTAGERVPYRAGHSYAGGFQPNELPEPQSCIQPESGRQFRQSSCSGRGTFPPAAPDRVRGDEALKCSYGEDVYVTAITTIGQQAIWDIGVEVTHNYFYGGSFSHNCWFDEEITDPAWLPEMLARLLDRRGRFVWSATPQAGTDQFLMLSERAEEEKGKAFPQVAEFKFRTADNIHFSDDDRNTLAADLSEEEIAVRLEGEFAALGFLMYPEFSMTVHGVSLSSFPNNCIPENWARYACIDPGNQVCAVLFAAVPPPSFGDYVYFYDELYIRNADVSKFGAGMAEKCNGQNMEAFIIDDHGSRRSEMIGKTIRQQFTDELRRRGVSSNRTKHGFIAGSDDIQGRNMAFRGWLRPRADGTTKLRVVRGKLPNFEHEIKYYRRKRIKGIVQDEPDARNNHLMDCCGYLAHCKSLRYARPKPAPKRVPPAVAYLKRKRENRRARNGGGESYVLLGAGAA